MERRNFLKGMVGVAGAGILAPRLIKGIEFPEEPEQKVNEINEVTSFKPVEIKTIKLTEPDFTKELFKYLETHDVNFKWKRIYDSIFQDENGKPYHCSVKKLGVGWCPEITQDVHSFGRGYSNGNDELEIIIREIVRELEHEYENFIIHHPSLKFYLKNLMTTPTFYNPICFTPRKGILLLYSKVI